jgi:CheY-like chemotaxis protein
MSGDTGSLRIVVVCASAQHRDLLRQGAAKARIPTEVLDAEDAVTAARMIGNGDIDVALVDGAVAPSMRDAVMKAAQAVPSRPFVILLAASRDEAERVSAQSKADAVAVRPATPEAAADLVERCGRVRWPSRVLLVDDSSTMRSIVRKILAGSRFQLQIAEAAEGVDALKQIASGKFDVVVLDYNMPGLNGIETLSEIKRQHPRIGVVMMTSTPNELIAERARAAGAAALLSKPFYPHDIDAALLSLAGLRAVGPR